MDAAMGAMGLGIVLYLRDQASAGLERVRGKLTGLKDTSDATVKAFDSAARQMLGGFGAMIAGTKTLGIVSSTFGSALGTAASFEQAMARVGAVSGATGDDFARLSAQARELGRETQFTASQAANAQENLARAGFATNEIISAMPGLLSMAAAEGMGLAEAADIAASTLRGFQLDADQAGRVADVLAKASAASNTSIAGLGEAMKYVAPISASLGVSLEETAAMIGVMSDAGIKGSMAGTALRAAFLRLSKEPAMTEKALKELGVRTRTSSGDLLSMSELMTEMGATMTGMGRADKLEAMSKIFGSEAASGMISVMEAVASGKLGGLTDALLGAEGAAAAMAETMNATAEGARKRLSSALESMSIVIGGALVPAYTWATDKMASFISWASKLAERFPRITKAIVGLIAGLGTAIGVALTFGGALMMIGGAFKMWIIAKPLILAALGAMKTKALLALGAFKAALIPIGAFIALGAALYAAWKKNLGGVRDMVKAVAAGFDMAVKAGADGVAKISAETADSLKSAGLFDFAVTVARVFWRIGELWRGFKEGFGDTVDRIIDGLSMMADAISPVLKGGKWMLEWLGLLSPLADSSASAWRDWGVALGKLAPLILAVVVAFKTAAIIKGIIDGITAATTLFNTSLWANPAVMIIGGVIAAALLLWRYWDEITEGLSAAWSWAWGAIKGAASAAWGWIKEGWDGLVSTFDLTGVFDGVYDAICGPFLRAFESIRGWWDELMSWFGLSQSVDLSAPVEEQVMSGTIARPVGSGSANPRVSFAPRPQIEEAPALPLLSKQQEAQGEWAGGAVAWAMREQARAQPVQVKNNIDMTIEPTTTDINLDGEKVGELVMLYQRRQAMREGAAWIP